MRFDFEQLHLMCLIKVRQDGRPQARIARELGIDDAVFQKFITGRTPSPTVNTVMTLMAWCGYEKFSDFVKEE